MKRVHYVDGSVIVSDEIALALLEYAQVLALNEKSDVVSVPVVGESGNTGLAQFLIGPASQLLSTPVAHDGPEPDSAAAVLELRTRARESSPDLDRNSPAAAGNALGALHDSSRAHESYSGADSDAAFPEVDFQNLRQLGDDFL